jgi:hypothetical protein
MEKSRLILAQHRLFAWFFRIAGLQNPSLATVQPHHQ